MLNDATESESATVRASKSLRFPLVYLLYGITVLAGALATFGFSGILPATLFVAFWWFVFDAPSRPRRLPAACLPLLGVGCFFGCLFVNTPPGTRDVARRVQCHNQLKTVALALQLHHDAYGSFPPAYLADDEGRPTHSWRVLILPFLDHQSLYRRYRFDEPWNGPNNRKLLPEMPAEYGCPSFTRRTDSSGTCTSYLAVVETRTTWPGAQPARFADISDGTANTILLVEAGDAEIPWMEPRDLDLDRALDLVCATSSDASSGHDYEDFFFA